MKMHALILFLVAAFLFSCDKKEKKVEYRLSDDQLTHMMYDIQVSDAAIMGITGNSADTLREIFWTRLSTIYGLTREEIKSEVDKLQADPAKMKIVFDSIKVWSDTIK
jgi:hypothetical protein